VIPVVTIPLALVGSAALMLAAGFSLNLLTLLAMVLAIGLVVDDAIVVVENIHRHIESGEPPRARAARRARDRVAGDRDDHHARCGVCADRADGRADRLVVPRVRFHARGGGVRVRGDRADALADAQLAAARQPDVGGPCRAGDRTHAVARHARVPAPAACEPRRAAGGAGVRRGRPVGHRPAVQRREA
jgi:hypothetical protein